MITNALSSDNSVQSQLDAAFGTNGKHTTMVNGRNSDTSVGKFLRNGILKEFTGKNKIVNGLEDPSFLGFTFIIKPQKTGLFGSLFDKSTNGVDVQGTPLDDSSYSALTYLAKATSKIQGENKQTFRNEWENLTDFVNGFSTICTNHPYVFQSIEGLGEAYKKHFSVTNESFVGSYSDTKIKVNCLESMDLRMLAIFDAYFKSIYNKKYMRVNIPRNLLYFDCYVLVHDIRNFNFRNSNTLQNAKNIAKQMSSVLFHFKRCMFDIDEIGSSFSTISNAEPSMTQFAFAFGYGNVDIYVGSLADYLDPERNNNVNIDVMNGYLDTNKMNDLPDDYEMSSFPLGERNQYDQYNNSGNTLLSSLMNTGEQIYNSFTSDTKFGNVYDKSTIGLVSNILSSVNGVSTENIISNLAYQGDRALAHKVGESLGESPLARGTRNFLNI